MDLQVVLHELVTGEGVGCLSKVAMHALVEREVIGGRGKVSLLQGGQLGYFRGRQVVAGPDRRVEELGDVDSGSRLKLLME
jgi:hypothetical protein